jgi:uridine kinase
MVAILLFLSSTTVLTQDLVLSITIGLLLIDLLALFSIHRLEGAWVDNLGKSAVFYASAPIVPAAILLAGSNDVIPMLLLFVAVWLVLKKNYLLGGALLGLAVGTKPLLLLALFAVALFVGRSSGERGALFRLSFGASSALVASFAPLIYSEGFRRAMLGSGEVSSVLYWGLETSDGFLPLFPGVLLICSVIIWRLRRMNGDLILVSTALPVFLLASLPNAPSGWALWSLPLVAVAISALSTRLRLFGWIILNFGLVDLLLPPLEPIATGVLNSVQIALVGSFAFLLWIELVAKNDLVKLLSRPALVLIAGDSGVGKDTLAEGLRRLLGENTTAHLSGDDYHKWDRGSENWQFFTHLNPKANDLDQYFKDLLDMISGRQVSVSHYDHSIGRTLPPQSSSGKEFVISSGLHSLCSKDLNSQASLKVFLEMSEELRVKTKLARDREARGHSERDIMDSISSRQPDYHMFVKPQSQSADLVFRCHTDESERSVTVDFTSDAKPFDSDLVNQLRFGCGLDVSTVQHSGGMRTISIHGEAEPITLSQAFTKIEPRISRALGSMSGWSLGAPGLVQLVTLVYLSNLLKRDRLVG